MNTLLIQSALDYAKRGFSVIPVEPRGKKPLVAWEQYQTQPAPADEIKKLFGTPGANMAIVTGKISGHVVIDIDTEATLNLTWDKVDLKSGFIHLDAEKTKTGEGRSISISPRLRGLLGEIWQREKGGKVVKITERVFLFRGRPIDRFDRAFKTACHKAEIEGLWIHDLRASFATRKIAERFDRDWVKMITRHRTDHVFRRYNRPNRPSVENLKAVVANDEVRFTPDKARL